MTKGEEMTIMIENIGISNISGIAELALSEDNMGDHRVCLNHDRGIDARN